MVHVPQEHVRVNSMVHYQALLIFYFLYLISHRPYRSGRKYLDHMYTRRKKVRKQRVQPVRTPVQNWG